MIRPFALLGFSAYAALALCMALGPENAWVLALLCLGLACGAAFVRVGVGFVWQRKGLLDQKELSEEPPMALSVFRGLFWAAAALAMAGLLCGMCALKWQQTEPLQELEGRRLTVRFFGFWELSGLFAPAIATRADLHAKFYSAVRLRLFYLCSRPFMCDISPYLIP